MFSVNFQKKLCGNSGIFSQRRVRFRHHFGGDELNQDKGSMIYRRLRGLTLKTSLFQKRSQSSKSDTIFLNIFKKSSPNISGEKYHTSSFFLQHPKIISF